MGLVLIAVTSSLQKFNQLIKRSFRPDMVSSTSDKVGKKIPKMKVEDDALSSGAKDINNNDTAKKGQKQKQSKKDIKQDLGDKKVDDPLAPKSCLISFFDTTA